MLCDRGGRELPIAADFVGRELQMPSEALLEVEVGDLGPTRAIVRFAPKGDAR
ncbi:MAG: hypothetical protein H5U40_10755 [Polyangiaceae bacterium]|nr:hypothetical protein [Polyangiaceae bacterium]